MTASASTINLCIQHWVAFILVLAAVNTCDGQSYFLNGTATASGDDCYQLTTTQSNQNGAVWYADFINLAEPFDLSFTMNFGSFDATGADGMVFVLQNVGTDALGQSGGALGFAGFDPSFGIEFDTWLNGQFGDLAVDHIGFISDGSVDHSPPTGLGGPIQASANGINIEDGQDHPVQITWDPATQIIAVYFDCTLRLGTQVDLINDIFNGQSLVYWGFTGSTGGSYNVQSVCLSENIIATGPETVICPGASVELTVVGSPNSQFTWDPPTFLSNPNDATTLCTPDSTTVYTVSYEGFCETIITDTITVFVEDLIAAATANPGTILTCTSPSIDLQGSSNFPSGVEYTWQASENGNIASTLGPQATVDAAGIYTMIVASDDGVCMDSTSVAISANFETIGTTLESTFPQLDCAHAMVQITATLDDGNAELDWSGPPNATWEWINEPFIVETSSSGTWMVVSTNLANGCAEETAIVLGSDFTLPIVEAGSADTITCASPAASISLVSVEPEDYTAVYSWSWESGGLIATDPLNPTALQPGMYTLEVTFEENGCSAMDSVWVYQDPEAFVDASSTTMPNIISPNGDGKNERFLPFLKDNPEFPILSIMDRYQLKIFNRWGLEVYSNQGTPVEWDGRVNGTIMADGIYYYIVEYLILCGGEQQGQLNGPLHIVR
jgi:gliding motility-associated-like protein